METPINRNLHHFGDRLTPYGRRPMSEAVTVINSPNEELSPTVTPYDGSTRHSSMARRRWAASMHAMYLIRIFESFLHNPFYSLVLSLRMFGLIININSKTARIYPIKEHQIQGWILRIFRYFLMGFMLVYILYNGVKTTITITSGGIWTNLKVLISAWITLWTVLIFLLRHNQIGSLMIDIQAINSFVPDFMSALKRRVMIVIGGVWIYLAISVITFFLDFSYLKSKDLFVINYGNWEVSDTIASLVVYVDTILNVYFVRGTLLIIITTQVLLCHSIECLFKDLNDFTKVRNKQNRDLTLKGLRELKNRHQLLAIYSEELDSIFSFVIFLWFILVLISLCITVNQIITGEYSSANLEGWISSIWSLGITFFIYIGISLASSRLNSESIDSALSIEKLANSQSVKSEGSFYFELILFLSRISLNPIQLTCYKFFAIKKFLILIIALIVIAYYFFVVHYNIIQNMINKS